MVTTTRNNLVESIEPMKAPASTAFLTGSWVKADGTGGVVPLTPTAKVLGLCGETVSSTDSNYATAKYISVDTVSKDVDRFLMPVTTGTATAAMEQSTFDVDAGNSYGLDVSGAGTQFRITKFISATQVEVSVLLTQ